MDNDVGIHNALEEHSRLKKRDQKAIEALLKGQERLMVKELMRRHLGSRSFFNMRVSKPEPDVLQHCRFLFDFQNMWQLCWTKLEM
ncbi:hypothetical protein [Candidatus Phycosocius spiralis]|uniref:Uncharacterized protein n=1 Tax=Candidatus Phycosocius spiralis TaxID=2815099 RepID=A0ABQ4PY99_9PROT|nr:hypothetical protein [Candidatus Phycosocius spiralis]GIU68055.1 hypothetical protein PsB1_2209 [Candidatus Phycosocius spiralis]